MKQLKMPRKQVELISAPVIKSPLMASFCKKETLWIKDCSQVRTSGDFSSGTFKDYRSCQLVNRFGEKNPVLYSIAYSSAGFSLGGIAREYNALNKMQGDHGVLVVSVIDEKLHPSIKQVLSRYSVLVELPLGKKVFSRKEVLDAVKLKIKDSHREFIDAENKEFSYAQLAQEIIQEKPDILFVPLGGGEAVNSILGLFAELTDSNVKVPYLYAATIRANVFAGNAAPGQGSSAEKLVTPHSELTEKIQKLLVQFGKIVIVEEEEIAPVYLALKKAGILVEPSAAVAFAAAKKISCPKEAKILVVNSGSGIHFDLDGILQGV